MKRAKPRKTIVVLTVLASLAIVFFGVVVIQAATGSVSAAAAVAEVNGEEITVAEFSRELVLQRSAVLEYFKRKYEAEWDKDFWQTEYSGEVPARMAREWALKAAVRTKVALQLAKSQGLIADSSYDSLLAEMKRENVRRDEAVRASHPVYGPVHFDENTFADYYISSLLIRLKESLSGKELAVSDEQLIRYYETVKDKQFRLEDNVRFSKLSVSYVDEGHQINQDKREQAESILEAVQQQLEQGTAIDEALNGLRQKSDALKIERTEEHFNNETARMYFKSQPELYAVLADSKQAETVSPVIDDRSAGRYVLAVIIEREAGGYSSFDEQKDNILKQYRNEQFEAYLDEKISEAEVMLVEDEYNSLSVATITTHKEEL